ncbi:MAG: hypothetical protein ACLGXA_14775 [Acidobacteriota bacterium]
MNAFRLDPAILARLNVRAAALLVPHTGRSAWTSEWTAELYHLLHTPTSDLGDSPAADPLHFSLGAFPDAFWLRCDHLRSHGIESLQAGSAPRCALVLASLSLTAFLLCLLFPSAWHALLPLHPARSADLVTISPAGDSGAQSPDIPLQSYLEWQTDTDKLFSQLAWYHPTVKNVSVPHEPMAHLSVALASDNLLQMLRVRIPDAPGSTQPLLVLSQSAWRTWYHSNPGILDGTATIDGRPVRIAILPDNGTALPATMEAWLLEDKAALKELSPHARGFVLARIRSSAFPPPRGGVRFMTETRYGVTHIYDCVSVSWLAWQPTISFLFALLLACLALPATTALPLGDYPRYRGRKVFSITARRWAFLAFKVLLWVAVVYFATIALAWGPAWAGSTPNLLQMFTAFPALLFGFRWILQDQRRRCPECLRRLSSPARVGQASCNFLSWNGTELFCVRGHGLLHIPELATSWCSTQRWLCLDSSWRCLFPESCSPGMI